jgi:glutamyl-tRNA reductase
VEILAVGKSEGDIPAAVIARWAGACGLDPVELWPHVYIHRAQEAIEHLFRVASSLDSMVLGEPQILGQLKKSYRTAVEHGTARVIVNKLLHKSFSVAKRVRTETGVASSAVSISYAAVELAKRIFEDIAGKRAMLIGAGEMAELAATHLLSSGVTDMLVANRTYERAQELAVRFKGEPVPFDDLVERLADVDIVISSTGSPIAIIQAKDIKTTIKKRKNRPMFFIDIAVPRDIDPDVNSLDNVYLYDIDDLREVVEENLAQRRDEADKARLIVQAEADAFSTWLRSLALNPTIVDLLCRGEAIARRELSRTLRQLGPAVPAETKQTLERLVLSLSRKLYHDPIIFLKRRSLEEDAADRFVDLTRRMFNLDDEDVPDDVHGDRKPDRGQK